MKRFLLLSVLVSVLVSCSAKKQMESAISHGNYDQAITDVLRKLENNKDKKRKQDYIVMLEDAATRSPRAKPDHAVMLLVSPTPSASDGAL